MKFKFMVTVPERLLCCGECIAYHDPGNTGEGQCHGGVPRILDEDGDARWPIVMKYMPGCLDAVWNGRNLDKENQ